MTNILFMAYIILSAIILPTVYFIFALFNKRVRVGFFNRFGTIKKPCTKKNIWLHVASLGEFNSVIALIKKLKSAKKNIIISTFTEIGFKKAKEVFPDLFIFFLPLDLFFLHYFLINRISPKILIIVETELWPCLIFTAYRFNVPIYIINARISEQAFRNYIIFFFFIKHLFSFIKKIYPQDKSSLDFFKRLGCDKSKLKYIGNLKFDIELKKMDTASKTKLRQKLKLTKSDIIWVCGSIRKGEEQIILEAFLKLKKFYKNLKIILVPRHLNEIKIHSSDDVFLIEEIGQLVLYYNIATFCFIGGTLVPIGGHNPLEAIYLGKPVIFGKYIANNRDAFQAIMDTKAGFLVEPKPEKIVAKVIYILKNIEILSKNAILLAKRFKGVTDNLIKELADEL